ncbi:MAG: membrane protein insertase YidC [Gemmatimonadaceae bacterium]|jgi:YidC/Oxa1 family membrane protein insertase|nr:membrane protein insertase YidC [Gemmatimonadaceae bacterium]
MEKRVFLAIALSLLVLTGYQYFFPSTPAPVSTVAPAATAANGTTPATAAPAGTTPTAAAYVAPASDPSARDIVVETESIRAVFSTQGAVLKHWMLKHYDDNIGRPLDLIPVQVPASMPRPFSLSTTDAALTATMAAAIFQPSAGDLSLGKEPGVLSFDYRDPATGLNVHKSYQFQPKGQPYVLNVEATIDVAGAAKPVTIEMGPVVGLGYNEQGARYGYPNQAVLSRAGKVERPATTDLPATPSYEGQFRFGGVGDHYFLAAALPGEKTVKITYAPVELPVPWTDPENRKRLFIAYSVASPGAASVPFFFGPKAFDTLRAVDVELVRTIDFGMFAFLVVPLLQALKWVNGYVSNFGWSIVVLTVLINVVLFPLRHKSMVSMKKMQSLQPKVKAIQDRYAKYKVTDPERQKMNQEMMALYKDNGVNPASGCVPMLLTLPILFAFYSLLAMSIELRHAPFIGYIQDLSMPDKYWITPLLMGATMFIQQRMMPSTADPIQQKMFLFMPIIFTFSFIWAPAGLVLYWLMSNLMAILQQYITNNMIGAKR